MLACMQVRAAAAALRAKHEGRFEEAEELGKAAGAVHQALSQHTTQPRHMPMN